MADKQEKPPMSFWTKISIVAGALVSLVFLVGVIYKLDCYNIAVHGDTVFAKDTELAREVGKDRCDLKKLREQLQLEQDIRKANSKLTRYNAEYRANLLFLNEVRKQYPNKDDIPSDTFVEYRKIKNRNEKLLEKIDKWEKKLDDLEVKELDTGGGQ